MLYLAWELTGVLFLVVMGGTVVPYLITRLYPNSLTPFFAKRLSAIFALLVILLHTPVLMDTLRIDVEHPNATYWQTCQKFEMNQGTALCDGNAVRVPVMYPMENRSQRNVVLKRLTFSGVVINVDQRVMP